MDDDDDDNTTASSAFQSPTFGKDGSFTVNEAVGSASISPCGRDIVLASRQGLHIIDLDNPYSPPRYLPHHTPWEVADVQWSPFASRDAWVVSTSNQKALVWNLETLSSTGPIQHVLHAHSRAITDINFSAHHPEYLATCAVDSFVHCWDLRDDRRPAISFADWFAGATQVKWNRQEPHIIASSHDKHLHIWDDRKGAHPLRTIEAHATKIYGIDWNRVMPSRLLTCSLDKTIKFWDYESESNEAHRIIQTDYPVWRARHTPFGHGVLAMPQRGNFGLHMYSTANEDGDASRGVTKPAYSFLGHQNSVKEFLWRTRGGIEDGKDMREFQLVSWSNDKTLMLHRVDEDVTRRIGYAKGDNFDSRINFTRRDAVYKTFKDEKQAIDSDPAMLPPQQTLGGLLRSQRRSSVVAKFPTGPKWKHADPAGGRSVMQARRTDKVDGNPITWMKGVKISKGEPDVSSGRESAQRITSSGAPPWETAESLGDEITHVGDKYKNIAFENVDVPGRSITVALNGPWGAEKGYVHTRVSMNFPKDYPESSPPMFTVEKRSAISEATQNKLAFDLRTIATGYVNLARGSVEAILCYLVGEQGLEESMSWIAHEQNLLHASTLQPADESSSDDEEDGAKNFSTLPAMDMDMSGHDLAATTNVNANIPLPKACGALWAENGQLVLFFPQKEEKEALVSTINIEGSDKTLKTHDTFEGFGRLPIRSSTYGKNTRSGQDDDSESPEPSDSSFESLSSSSSSSDSEDILPSRFQLHPAWRNQFTSNHPGSLDRSIKSSAPTMKYKAPSLKTSIFIHNVEDVLPAKRCLAQEYVILEDGPKACAHNATVAAKYGFTELADVWGLLRLILCNEVPLEVIPQSYRPEDVVVLAKRSLVQIRRRDSGLDLAFDDPSSISSAKLNGRVKWGQHPLGTELVRLILDYYESLADIQMVAMISCVFSESSIKHTNSQLQLTTENAAYTDIPALLYSYYPSAEVAWSTFQSPRSTTTPAGQKGATPEVYGSYESSNAIWGSDADTEQAASQSVGNTPPNMTRQHSRTSNGSQSHLEVSPEPSMKRSNSTVSNSLSVSFTRPFSFITSNSPPLQRTARGQAELSTSAPSSGSITWGRNVIYDDSSVATTRRSQPVAVDDDSDSETDLPIVDDFETVVSLKNQNMFDDEAYISMPFLDSGRAVHYKLCRRTYANLLASWGMPFAACEVLKFNGISSPTEPSNFAMRDLEDDTMQPDNIHESSSSPVVTAMLHCETCSASIQHDERAAETKSSYSSRNQKSSKSSSQQRCETCGTIQRRPTCTICYTLIRGLYKACVRCGHCSHVACLQQWLAVTCDVDSSNIAAVDSHHDIPCEAGCGCICSDIETNYNAPEPSSSSIASTSAMPPLITSVTESEAHPDWKDGEGDWYNVGAGAYSLEAAHRKVSNVAVPASGGPDLQDVYSWSRAATMLQKYQRRNADEGS